MTDRWGTPVRTATTFPALACMISEPMVNGEVGRFPQLARTYYDRVPGRVLDALTTLFLGLAHQGRLRLDDPGLAAQHFAWLVLGAPLDRGMFYAVEEKARDEDLDRLADAATRVFIAAYGSPRPS